MATQLQHRMTSQRAAVMDILKAKLDHPTADDVFHRVRKRMPRVSLATVYRNLDVLAEMGQVIVLECPNHPRRYDVTTEPHYHIRCVECGNVEDVRLVNMPDLAAMVMRECGHEVLSTRLEFDGFCFDCKTK